MLRIGYKASAEQFGPNELLEFSCGAEEVGFDSIFVSDHFRGGGVLPRLRAAFG